MNAAWHRRLNILSAEEDDDEGEEEEGGPGEDGEGRGAYEYDNVLVCRSGVWVVGS